MSKDYPRHPTKYPGVFFRIGKRLTSKGQKTEQEERIYYVVIKKNGQVIEERVGRQYADNMTPAKANNKRVAYIEGRETPKSIQRKNKKWVFDDIFTEWKQHYMLTRKIKKESKSLRSDIGKYTNHLKKIIGNKELSEITPLHINKIENKTAYLAPETRKHILGLIIRTSKFAVKRGLSEGIKINIDLPKVNSEVTEDLSPEEIKRLLKALKESDNVQVATMLKMVLLTGMRRGELCKLCWDDINWGKKFIRIKGPKGGTDQTIPLNDNTYKLLKDYPRTKSPYVFPGKTGNQLINPNEAAKKIMIAAKLPDSFRPFHGLRHVFASMLASSGQVDLYTLQKLLTHKTPKMTMRYAHLRDEALKRAAGVASDIIGQAMKPENDEATG